MISFTNLRKGYVIGIIDYYGCVHSKFFKLNEEHSHGNTFQGSSFKRWRWYAYKDIQISPFSSTFDIEEIDKVRRHLTKKYRIKFTENGAPDLQFFKRKVEEEKIEESKNV